MTDRKPPVETVLDALLYAPLGLALEARTLLPSFVARGRAQVQMARIMGQFAVEQGQREAAKRLTRVPGPVGDLLVDLGLAARPTPPPPGPPPAPSPAPEAASPSEPPPELIAVAPAGPPAADLAIPDYDSLAASQVLPRLRALTGEELDAVRAYEAAGRARKTILNRIAQIQGA